MADQNTSNRGSVRHGAGRKKGSNVYGESKQAIRVPESLLPKVKSLLPQRPRNAETAAKLQASAKPSSTAHTKALAKFLAPARSPS